MKTVEEVIAEEIDSICVNYWYDGISWEHHLTNEERERAYEAVFAEMLRVGRYELGMVEPYVHHNGNGHYVVADSRRKP